MDTQRSFHGKLIKRTVSALVMAPVTVAILFIGGPVFYALVLAAFVISLYEWLRISPKTQYPVVFGITGPLYLGMCFASFVMLRLEEEQGLFLCLSLLTAVWASDVCAYLAGKTFGGPKLIPALSPKKTWAGLGGAMLGAGAFLLLAALAAPVLRPWITSAVTYDFACLAAVFVKGCVLGLVGQTGDLMISVLKRQAGVKDTGHLIPGHGGILDRIDALLLATPAYVLLSQAAGWR